MQQQEKPTSALAVTSLILGVLSIIVCLGPLTGIPALILGIIAIPRINKLYQQGKGMAIAGIATGAVSSILWILVAVGIFFVGYKLKENQGFVGLVKANSKISNCGRGTYFGNTTEAKKMAGIVSVKLKEVCRELVDEQDIPASEQQFTKGNFLTYCNICGDKIIFLVHVPGFRHYNEKDRINVLDHAWDVVGDVLAENSQFKKVAIGLRGVLLFSAFGEGQAGDDLYNYSVSDLSINQKLMYPYFDASGLNPGKPESNMQPEEMDQNGPK